MKKLFLVSLILIFWITAWTAVSDSSMAWLVNENPPPPPAFSTSAADLPKNLHDSCPVTLPVEPLFTPPAPYPPMAPYEGQFWYGTERLWTALPTDGKWLQLAYGEKVFWWRNGYDASVELQPALSVSARRLDAEAPTVEFGPPATNASHPDFHTAMLIGVDLPASGCWEITGHYAGNDLPFVIWVGD